MKYFVIGLVVAYLKGMVHIVCVFLKIYCTDKKKGDRQYKTPDFPLHFVCICVGRRVFIVFKT